MDSGGMEFVIAVIVFGVIALFVLIDSVFTGGKIRFGKNSFRKREEPMYDDDRSINRYFKE